MVTEPSTCTEPSGWRRTPCDGRRRARPRSRRRSPRGCPPASPAPAGRRTRRPPGRSGCGASGRRCSWSFRLVVSGMNQGSRSDGGDVELVDLAAGGGQRAQQVARVQHADDVLRVRRGRAAGGVWALSSASATSSRGGRSASSMAIDLRWTMTSVTSISDRSSTPPSIQRSRALHQALGVVVLDRAADLLVGGQHVGLHATASCRTAAASWRTIHWAPWASGPKMLHHPDRSGSTGRGPRRRRGRWPGSWAGSRRRSRSARSSPPVAMHDAQRAGEGRRQHRRWSGPRPGC